MVYAATFNDPLVRNINYSSFSQANHFCAFCMLFLL